MSKSILVINTPKNCYECNLQVHNPVGEHICVISKKSADYCASRADKCPLEELPEKRKHTDRHNTPYDFDKNSKIDGWNACIDKILKGSDMGV